MANKIYVDNALVVYDAVTGTVHPGVGLVLDGLNQQAAVPQTVIATPSVSGIYLITLYLRIKTPASGDGTPASTIGPVTVYFSCADCLVPVQLISGLLLQDGNFAPTNSANVQNVSLSGSVLINALAGQPISISIGYASSPATTTAECTATLSSDLWNAALVDLLGAPVYVSSAQNHNTSPALSTTVTYSPTAGNSTILMFNSNGTYTGLTCKDNLNNVLSSGPTQGYLAEFHQTVVPAGVTSYTVSWTHGPGTTRLGSLEVAEYSGVTSINTSLAGNTATGTSGTADITVTPTSSTDKVVVGFGSSGAVTFTGTVGTPRQSIAGSGSATALMLIENAVASVMAYNYHLKAVFVGGIPA